MGKASLANGDGEDVKIPVFQGAIDAGLDMLFSGQQAEVELLKKSDDKDDQKMGNWIGGKLEELKEFEKTKPTLDDIMKKMEGLRRHGLQRPNLTRGKNFIPSSSI